MQNCEKRSVVQKKKNNNKNKADHSWVILWEQIVVIYGMCRKQEAIITVNREFSPKCWKRRMCSTVSRLFFHLPYVNITHSV